MTKLPPFPRCDPDHEIENPSLATIRWQSAEKAIEMLSYDENDPDMADAVYLGRVHSNGKAHLLGHKSQTNSHLVTFAASGAGKTSTLIMPSALTYKGSMIINDPKGELASTTYHYRAEVLGQKVLVIDGFGRSRVPHKYKGSLNALSNWSMDTPELLEKVGACSGSMVINGDAKSLHFDEAARSFIKSVILYVLTIAGDDKELRSFAIVRELLTSGINGSLDELLSQMLQVGGKYASAIAAGANMVARAGDNERGSILSTVNRNTEFLDSPQIIESLSGDGIDLAALKDYPGVTIYIVLPEEYLDEYSRYVRLLISTLLTAVKQTPPGRHPVTGKPLPPILFVLEELASLGYMPQIERAAGIMRAFGARLWFIWQDINQAKMHYPKTYDSLIGNASIVTAFGNGDNTTLEYLSKRLGVCQVRNLLVQHSYQAGKNQSSGSLLSLMKEFSSGQSVEGESRSRSVSQGTTVNYNEQIQKTPLMQPDEIARYFSAYRKNMLVSVTGALPICLPRIAAHEDPLFQARLKPNPFHAD
jgi:type IV secretion system protein VirD4